jgi:chemotaxis protein CheY-P-specific phosphatase CheC
MGKVTKVFAFEYIDMHTLINRDSKDARALYMMMMDNKGV